MYCKNCNLYSDTKECPRCGRLLGDASSKKQERDRHFHLIQDYCTAAYTAFVFAIIAVVLPGLEISVVAPIALIFKAKAKKIEASMRFNENDMNLPSNVMNKYHKAQKRLTLSQKLMKIAAWLLPVKLILEMIILMIIC